VLLHWLDGSADAQRVPAGSGADVGPVKVMVDASDAPWPDARAIDAQQPKPAGSQPLQPTAIPAPQPEARPEKKAAAAAQPAVVISNKVASGAIPAWAAGAISAVALAIVGGVWWAMQAPSPAKSAVVSSPKAPEDPRARILAIASKLGLEGRVSVAILTGGAVTVRAMLLTEDESVALASALSSFSPRPGLSVTSDADLKLAVSDAIERIGAPSPLTARYLGGGRFRIEGNVKDADERSRILAALRTQVPDAREFQSGLLTQEEVGQALAQDLRDQGLQKVDARWEDGVLLLKVRLAATDVPMWEQALQAAVLRHPIPFRATTDVSAVAAPVTGRLPWNIRSVVGGEPAYVVLQDGSKMMTDGTRDGWRLVSITPQSVVFESPRGGRISVDR
jgi:type III secretion protein D